MIRKPNPHTLKIGATDVFDNNGAVALATITVGAEASDVRAITVQLKDASGVNITYAAEVQLVMLLNAGGTDYVATGGSTGIAIGASGKLQAVIAKKRFHAISTTAGVIALTWTDTGTEVAYLGVKLPNGKMVVSAALTNA
jgi:hypothetical protein